MRIGIIGTGNMGRTLGALWAELGHDVLFGARSPPKASDAKACVERLGVKGKAAAGSNNEAAKFGELVYWNPRDVPVLDVLSKPELLDGKSIIESHNGTMPGLFEWVPTSLSHSERLQEQLPQAKVVKAFNTMAREVFELCPELIRPHQVSVFLASNFPDAKNQVQALVNQMGFLAVDCGTLKSSRQLEGLGDFIRSIIIDQKQVGATLSVRVLPSPASPRFGPRIPTRLT